MTLAEAREASDATQCRGIVIADIIAAAIMLMAPKKKNGAVLKPTRKSEQTCR